MVVCMPQAAGLTRICNPMIVQVVRKTMAMMIWRGPAHATLVWHRGLMLGHANGCMRQIVVQMVHLVCAVHYGGNVQKGLLSLLCIRPGQNDGWFALHKDRPCRGPHNLVVMVRNPFPRVMAAVVVHVQMKMGRCVLLRRRHQQPPPPAGGAQPHIRNVDLGDGDLCRVGHRLLEAVLNAIDVVLESCHREVAADGHDQGDPLGVGAPEARVADAVEQGGAAGGGVGPEGAVCQRQWRGAVGVGRTVKAIGCQAGAHKGEFADRAGGAPRQIERSRRVSKCTRGAIRRHAGPSNAELAQRAGGAMGLGLGARGGSERASIAIDGRRGVGERAVLPHGAGQAHRLARVGLKETQAAGDGRGQPLHIAQVAGRASQRLIGGGGWAEPRDGASPADRLPGDILEEPWAAGNGRGEPGGIAQMAHRTDGDKGGVGGHIAAHHTVIAI